jgi:iron complex outermembrane recepter protein
LFWNKYDDIQLTRLTCDEFSPFPGAPCALPVNGGDADVKGAELEVEAHPVAGLMIDASLSHLDFKYTSVRPDVGIPKGSTAPGTIKTKYSFGMQYAFGMAAGGTLTPRFDMSYQSGLNTNAVITANNRVPGYHLGNARLTWDSPEDKWQGAFVVTNVFDKTYYISLFDLLSSSGAKYATPANPREYSIEIKRKF